MNNKPNKYSQKRHDQVTQEVLTRFEDKMKTQNFIELSFYGSRLRFWMGLDILDNNNNGGGILNQDEFDSGEFDYIIDSLFDIHYAKNKYKIKPQMRADMRAKKKNVK
jgi:hypothetical protein